LLSPDVAEAEALAGDIAFFLGGDDNVIYLPPFETLPYETLSPHPDISAARRKAVRRLALRGSEPLICVTTRPALMQLCPPRDIVTGSWFRIKTGGDIDLAGLRNFLDDTGYFFSDPVEEQGAFAVRGGVMDIFPPLESKPVRIELFGDEVESIRRFDPSTQRSLEWLEETEIPPFREMDYGRVDMDYLMEKLASLESEQSVSLEEIRAKFEGKQFFPAMELYLPYFWEPSAPVEYLPPAMEIVASEPETADERFRVFLAAVEDGYGQAIERGEYYPPPAELYRPTEKIKTLLNPGLVLASISIEEESGSCKTVKTLEAQRYRGGFNRFAYDCRRELSRGMSVLIIVCSDKSAERVGKLFLEEELGIRRVGKEDIADIAQSAVAGESMELSLMVAVGSVSAGFASDTLAVRITTEEEIFGRYRPAAGRRPARKPTVFATDFSDIAPGDYVVHRDHGIGLYHGTKTVRAGESADEYLELEYAEHQSLFLPISSVYLLEKYSGAGGPKPPLDRMGGATWRKTRDKVKKGIMQMAGELLELYAKRETDKGYRFDTAGAFNREFADTFEHMETPDQAAVIEEVLRDMASEKPMDRLVCGDVGYGKTEIAMRAAFAAAVEGKQTALLAPTTLLANQHYENFRSRMEPFGVKVEMVNRFVPAANQKKILKELGRGKADVIIGTHRLLQKDVSFNDLGLVIVDEEQRFGVRHKEKLKKYRATVDVLTLTATPIPRTLYMSFSGIRDISIINTPPPGRRAIKTFIRKREDGIIREAVNREIARGGQTFFVHNSIETIGPMARHLRKILPHARMAVAHGRMNGAELEQTMEEFIKHKVDILLCTTIIESGLDIPNANTIIINRADQLGLAQLYQLRGRVGRDRHRAYAYLLVPEVLSSLAQKRISAIEELSTLGSGFRLAARDMEIRGTGNLLGAKQSGHVTAVGFETYCRMLQETVDELKTGRTTAKMETKLDLDFVGKLEEIYIKPLDQRMNYYNRLHRADSPEEIRGIRDELADRYGSLPQKARKLVQAAVLRSAGSALGIEKITVNGNLFSLTFAESCERVVEITSAAGHSFPGRIRPTGERTLQIAVGSGDDRIERITAFLEEAATQEMEAETV